MSFLNEEVARAKSREMIRDMLTYRRPHKAKSEKRFADKFLSPLGVVRDGIGNHIKRIGDSPVMWSSHVDTVHSKGGRQRVTIRGGVAALAHNSKSNCLGADCAAGIWLMSEMIRREIPGLYVFHRGEECGGIGSTFISNETPQLLDGIKYVIALDRAGFDDVITHQSGERGCSDDFAEALAAALGGQFAPDPTGTFTDSANYVSQIPECTNVSVGYENQHTAIEMLDTTFLIDLLEKLCALDVSSLPYVRDPSISEYDAWHDYRYDLGYSGAWTNFDKPVYDGAPTQYVSPVNGSDSISALDPLTEMLDAIKLHPEAAAELLISYGISVDEIWTSVFDQTGIVPVDKFKIPF